MYVAVFKSAINNPLFLFPNDSSVLTTYAMSSMLPPTPLEPLLLNLQPLVVLHELRGAPGLQVASRVSIHQCAHQ